MIVPWFNKIALNDYILWTAFFGFYKNVYVLYHKDNKMCSNTCNKIIYLKYMRIDNTPTH